MPTISQLSIHHNTSSDSAQSNLAILRVGPDKEWDSEWTKTKSEIKSWPRQRVRLRVGPDKE